MGTDHKNILIIAGEASGDNHGAEVVKVLKAKHPEYSFQGIAGPKMRKAGVKALIESEAMAFMGFVEVLKHMPQVLKAYKAIKKAIVQDNIDGVILIDYPGFNLKIAALAKKHGCKVLYYISPQIWAWKQGRIKKIKAYVDMMAVIFPFEKSFYKKFDVPVEFVGSPLIDTVHCDLSKTAAREAFGLATNKTTIALLPGSREAEIKRMLPVMLDAAKRIDQANACVQFILPVASTLNINAVKAITQSFPKLKVFKEQAFQAIRAADVVISTSGTATLETALLQTPLIIVYKMNWLSFQIIKRLIKINTIGLCNIVAETKVADELIQGEANAKNIAQHALDLLDDKNKIVTIKTKLKQLHQKLGSGNAAENVAKLVVEVFD